ncbi:MAG: anthranilate phosphoribosyltransferase, partial [Thermodesulfobacteriota bacterium]
GIAFMYAPIYHSAMKYVAKTRKEIGIRTVFNLIGPLVNPASAKYQLIGVYSEALLKPIAKVLRNLGSIRAMIVHGADSMDEITVTGKTHVAELKEGVVKKYQIDPLEFGFNISSLEHLQGGKNAKENAEITLSILNGEDEGPKRDIAVFNAAAAILVAKGAENLKDAIEIASNSIVSGHALKKLKKLSEFTKANSIK